MTIYYVSNEASNGYALGSDSNNGRSKSAPFLTWDKAATVGIQTDRAYVNPSSVAYSENSGGTSYFDMGTIGWIGGDPDLAGAVTNALLRPTIKSAAASRVINVPTDTVYQRVLGPMLIDCETGGSKVAVIPHGQQGGLVLQQVGFRRVALRLMDTPTGAENILLLDRIDIDKSNTYNSTSWNWYASASTFKSVVTKGGLFSHAPSSNPMFYFNGLGCTEKLMIIEDDYGILPLFNGGGTALSGVQIRLDSITTPIVRIRAKITADCGGGIVLGRGGNMADIIIENCDIGATGTTYNISINGTTTTSVIIRNNKLVNGKGCISVNSENATACRILNNEIRDRDGATIYCTIAATNGYLEHGYNKYYMDKKGITVSFCTGANGFQSDRTNTASETVTQNLGDIAGTQYVEQFWTTLDDNSTSRAPCLGNINLYLKKVGSPDGTVVVAVFDDNAGVPGNLVATSDTTITASTIPTSTTLYNFSFMSTTPALAKNSKYHARVRYTGTIDGVNYVGLGANATTTIGSIQKSADGAAWSADATRCLRSTFWTGWYGASAVCESHHNEYFWTLGDNREHESTTIGAITTGLVHHEKSWNGGYHVLFKNTKSGGGRAYSCFGVSDSSLGLTGFYAKASDGVEFDQCTSITTATSGCCFQANTDSIGATNPIPALNMKVRNSIAMCGALSYVYVVHASCTGFDPDYNIVYTLGTTIDQVSAANWATWQAVPYDAHSLNVNPLLPGGLTPTKIADIVPQIGTPPVSGGTAITGITSDLLGQAWGTNPSIGAIQFAGGIGAGSGASKRKLF